MEKGKKNERRKPAGAKAGRKPPKQDSVHQPEKGRRFTPEQREHALLLVASGMRREKIASLIGTTPESIRRWLREAESAGTMPPMPEGLKARGASGGVVHATESREEPEEDAKPTTGTSSRSPYTPKDPGQGLSEPEVAAILEWKKKHPSMGPAQIRTQLKRFKGWRISVKAIARVLRAHGYETVHRGSRPQGPEPTRFEAPRPNALWQADYGEFRVGPEKLHLLIVIDDFSRYVVGHGLFDSPTSEAAVQALRPAIARHGKPEAIRTDRAGGFLAGEFTDFLETQLIDHVVGRSYNPKGGGKVEAVIGTVRRELWDVEHFASREEAVCRVDEFLDAYNDRRAHMGIDGLTPADRYHGRADKVLAVLDAVSRKRQGAFARLGGDGRGPVEEVTAAAAGSPMEILRLVLADDVLELRFCGARVRLGSVER